MNVPEGLRNISFASYPLTVGSWEGPVRAVRLDHLESWFASHELVDLTVCGPQCPAWTRVVFDHDEGFDECESLHTDPPTGQPCPVMAARKEGT